MLTVVNDIFYYPVKGTRAVSAPDHLTINPKVGGKGDRNYGIRRQAGDMSRWAPKTEFFAGVNTPQMVAETPYYLGTPGKSRNPLSPEYLDQLAQRLQVPRAELMLQDTGGE